MGIKKIIKKLIYGYKASSKDFVKYLRTQGVRIGAGTEFIDPKTTHIDLTRPWMVEIGSSCCIVGGGRNTDTRLWVVGNKSCLWRGNR